jgi:hypothetical protein
MEDEAIAEEERLIRIYEAEIALLSQKDFQKEEGSLLTTAGVDEDENSVVVEDDDPLVDWMLNEEDSSTSSLLASLSRDDTNNDHHRFQPVIRGFCFTSVQQHKKATSILRGYFVADPSIRAQIRVAVSSKHKTIESLECQLVDVPEEWRWLETEVVPVTKRELAPWIEAVSSYLAFHKERQVFLQLLQERFEKTLKVEYKRSKVLLNFSITNSNVLSLVWGWKWKEGREFLRWMPSACSLPHLDALVQVCDDRCDKAIELLVQQIQTNRYKIAEPPRQRLEDQDAGDADVSSEEEDDEPVTRKSGDTRKERRGQGSNIRERGSTSKPAKRKRSESKIAVKRKRRSGYLIKK